MSDEIILSGTRFRVRFFRWNDRYAHLISLIEQASELPLLTSEEGSADDPWPPSPPFQGLHVEQREAQPVALLVGMAGNTHWSAAVTIHVAKGTEQLQFDIACRSQRPPVRLQSRYRLSQNVLFDAAAAELRTPLGACQIAPVQGGTTRMILTPTAEGLEIGPRELQLPLPATWRFGYMLTAAQPRSRIDSTFKRA